ncbi:IS110 family transposase [Demequina sp. NBRC 110055]|uniref:IS110 family transposase n=1 Tax=Demequina sp. NBRC 110055 TaxID=1570344 RepID=UPI0009FEEB60|nr:IS110 family transposase [Demequina sp. NBRC 110055]
MTTFKDPGQVVAGIDTHSLTHHVAVLAATGARLGDREFPATPAGHGAIAAFIASFGTVSRVGIEGTGSYGAALSRSLRAEGLSVAEVIRPKRAQRRRGKSDPIDAYAAAEQALANTHLPIPKDGDGVVEQIRALLSVRRSAVKARASAMQQIKSLLVTAPDQTRARWRSASDKQLISGLAATRPEAATLSVVAATTTALRILARRYQHLSDEITAIEADLHVLVHQANPELAAAFGIGITTAAQILVTAGDNPVRLRSEAAFAALCGVAPIPASSGKTTRHRLNRGGDRDANRALHTVALVRMSHEPRTRDYVARRTTDGKTTKDIIRCLKRAIAREVWHLLTHPTPVPDITDLRPLRVSKAITIDTAARHFGHWSITISRLERGELRDDNLATAYRTWLATLPNATPTKRMLTLNTR